MDMSGYWTDDKNISEAIEKAAEISGERTWRMPLHKPYAEQLKSDCADTANIGGPWGGSITAALFLKQFVGDTPWMHLDIAGPFWAEKSSGYLTKGATGYGPRLLYRFITQWAGTGK
jgi:leucyl aminopeptidase